VVHSPAPVALQPRMAPRAALSLEPPLPAGERHAPVAAARHGGECVPGRPIRRRPPRPAAVATAATTGGGARMRAERAAAASLATECPRPRAARRHGQGATTRRRDAAVVGRHAPPRTPGPRVTRRRPERAMAAVAAIPPTVTPPSPPTRVPAPLREAHPIRRPHGPRR